MKPYWVETGNQLRVAIVPRPRGGDWLEDELDQMKRAGVDVLVSMLQVDEAAELGLSSEAELWEIRGHDWTRYLSPRIAAIVTLSLYLLKKKDHPGRASTVCEVCALSDLDNISVRIADVAARLAVLGDRLRDELRSSTFP
jgi:hypothetical protein